jgi:hypothetical protein
MGQRHRSTEKRNSRKPRPNEYRNNPFKKEQNMKS